MKLCECGCGEPTRMIQWNNRALGYIAGDFYRFVSLHRQKLKGPLSPTWKGGRHNNGAGYVKVVSPGHPRARKGTEYVYEHILIAERALRRTLPLSAQVHHVNEVPSDNRAENLVICEDDAYHKLLHARAAAYRAAGDVTARRCQHCGKWDAADNVALNKRCLNTGYHLSCRAAYARAGKKRRNSKKGMVTT